ncbi:DUF1801 domain-containing protein [Microbacterium sp. YY-01]|uniref:DUF1801 domain-containing protein n=1 Tax=Microbacterium sp. YY-01 TaxID=3421634 RepID=UPI003D183A73
MAREPAMRPSDTPVAEVLDKVTGPRRAEAEHLVELHRELSGHEPVVWAGRIIGFGEMSYQYESGHGGVMPELGFATSQSKHTLYLATGFAEKWPELLERLGKHKASKACLYLSRLIDVDDETLRELLQLTLVEARK